MGFESQMCEIPLHNVQGIHTNWLSLSRNPYFTTPANTKIQKLENVKKKKKNEKFESKRS